jgi:hypothetical protein
VNRKPARTRHLTQTNQTHVDPEVEERDDAIIGVAFWWSLAVMVGGAGVVGALVVAMARPAPPAPLTKTTLAEVEIRESPKVELPAIPFTDVTELAGIRFHHENGADGQKLLPETMGGGCAFFDFDGDGDQDLLLVNSKRWPWNREESDQKSTTALYCNDGTGRFADVTPQSGLDVPLYGMGVATGDYDGDGRVDVFLSAVGTNRLYHNEGDGKFRDVSQEAGVGGDADEWSTSCGWFDYDNDGDLDLFVCNYVKWSRAYDKAQNFQLVGGGRAYGRPQSFEGTFPYLYRNNGNGRFDEVADSAGLHVRNPATGVPVAKSLAVSFVDFDRDGYLDIVVANDTVQNFLFHNEGHGTFREIGTAAGIAYDMSGNARGAMGIDVACFRNDDTQGIAIGNFANEMTALYVAHDRQMQFVDEAISTGLGPVTRSALTFGLFYADFDLDGRLDLFAANGHLEEDINRVQASQHYEQSPQLFWNSGPQQATEFVLLPPEKCGADLLRPLVGRGAAYADIDGDGDLDVLVTATGQRPRLLRNDHQHNNHWLRLTLIGAGLNRDAIGARVEVELKDRILRRQVMPTRSYLSQVELPLTIGLCRFEQVRSVTVHWPDGSRQVVDDVQANQAFEVRQ